MKDVLCTIQSFKQRVFDEAAKFNFMEELLKTVDLLDQNTKESIVKARNPTNNQTIMHSLAKGKRRLNF